MVYELEIHIDCGVHELRPDTYFDMIMKELIEHEKINISDVGKSIKEKYSNPISNVFGNWGWILKIENKYDCVFVKDFFRARLTELYNNGCIRYASWN